MLWQQERDGNKTQYQEYDGGSEKGESSRKAGFNFNFFRSFLVEFSALPGEGLVGGSASTCLIALVLLFRALL